MTVEVEVHTPQEIWKCELPSVFSDTIRRKVDLRMLYTSFKCLRTWVEQLQLIKADVVAIDDDDVESVINVVTSSGRAEVQH